MAQGNVSLTINNNNFSKQKSYTNMFENIYEVDNTDGFINVLNVSTTKGANTVSNIKSLCLHNIGSVGAEIQFTYQEWKNNSNTDEKNSVDTGGGATVTRYATMLLPSGDFIYLPNGRLIGYNADASGGNATSISNTAPNSNEYTDSGANLSSPVDSPDTSINVTDGSFFKVGDLIQFGDNNATSTKLEVMEVTAITDTAGDGEFTPAALAVTRALHGSNLNDKDAQTDGTDGVVSGANVYFPFFNAYNNWDRYSVAQTNKNGKFKCMNFFGYGRTADAISNGLVAGSVCFKFYKSGYQELGLSGVTANTNTGLAASTAYQFQIAVDGGSAYDLDVTTDSSNTNFGGKNGVLSKIQDVFDTQYYTTSSNLFGKRVTVSILNGDVRFTSGSHLSTSAIALSDSSGGDTDIFGVGRITAFANIESAIPALLPDDTFRDRITYEERPNTTAIMYDDGNGNLIGAGNGVINYETGAVDFTAGADAEFVLSATYLSAHSGGTNVSIANGHNHITSIGARSTNQKLNAKVRVIAMN